MGQRTNREARIGRHLRVRRRVHGTAERPRLCVFRSSRHVYAQVIDDESGRTLAAACDLEPAIAGDSDAANKTARAALVGRVVAERARSANVEKVIFDRGGFKFHGRVKALAEAARKAGLGF